MLMIYGKLLSQNIANWKVDLQQHKCHAIELRSHSWKWLSSLSGYLFEASFFKVIYQGEPEAPQEI